MLELTVVFYIFLAVVAVAWVLLPFAMFGLKPLLRELIAEQRMTNHHLVALLSAEQAAASARAIAAESQQTVEISAPWEN